MHNNTNIMWQMLCWRNVVQKFTMFKDVEELGFLWMSVKLLPSAVQRDFEMEILRRRAKLEAVEGCESETADTISYGRFPFTNCQSHITLPCPTPDI